MTSPYTRLVERKRKWTPVAVTKGKVVEGSEDSLYRALALRTLELPVKENTEVKSIEKIEGIFHLQ